MIHGQALNSTHMPRGNLPLEVRGTPGLGDCAARKLYKENALHVTSGCKCAALRPEALPTQ